MQIFEEILFFKPRTRQKQTIHLSFASWILAEGRGHETDLYSQLCSTFFFFFFERERERERERES